MVTAVKRLLVGTPKRTEDSVHERLTKKTALAVFSSDALSSTAYASEEILLVLAAAAAFGQAQAFRYLIPISIAIAVVLGIVVISYRQTIRAYPSGGGAYVVAKDNLGTYSGLVAAAALLVDYILTVSVSVSAGVAAITSAAQHTEWAWLDNHKVTLCLFMIAGITVANLRGVRESGAVFAGPTYAFLFCFFVLIGYGLLHYYFTSETVTPLRNEQLKLAEGYHAQPLTWLLLLGAFANGCVALTGTEAISNGIPAFKPPEARSAATTLLAMAVLLGCMFLGTSLLAYLYQVHPHNNETIISQFARIIFRGPLSWFYYAVQASTALILVLAANTSFADFPRLASLLARDRFLPRQFASRGDRLVFSNGVIILASLSGILVVVFSGDTSRLIPLYAVGVFLSFTLSQLGMVRHWLRIGRAKTFKSKEDVDDLPALKVVDEGERLDQSHVSVTPEDTAGRNPIDEAQLTAEKSHWRRSIIINLIGAIVTTVVLIVLIVTKFVHGAWLVIILIPLLVLLFRAIQHHYLEVARQLTMEGWENLRPIHHEVIVPISGVHRGVIRALEYAKSIAPGHVSAVYVDLDEEATRKIRDKWEAWDTGVQLVVLASPYRSLIRPLTKYIERRQRLGEHDMLTVVLPEFVPARWWHQLLHNQSSLLLKGAFLFKRGVIVTNIPYHLER